MKITDAMVEAILTAYYDPIWPAKVKAETADDLRISMRAALTAALAVGQENAPGSFRAMLASPNDEPTEIKLAKPEISRRIPLRAAPVAAPVQVKALK